MYANSAIDDDDRNVDAPPSLSEAVAFAIVAATSRPSSKADAYGTYALPGRRSSLFAP
jgi:hypothetical protein